MRRSIVFFRHWLFKAMPKRAGFMLYLLGTNVALAYNDFHLSIRDALVAWHRRELTRLDPDFGLDAISREKPQRQESGEPVGSGTAFSDSPDILI